MASDSLEERIIKIKLQNEEIRRRYEEVEADKKNAEKSNALVKMIPSDNWPERKEPPEFSAPSKTIQKQKVLNKEHNDRLTHYSGIQERLGKKDHKFAQGDGPPPDPKYNFLADSEREIHIIDNGKVDEGKIRPRNKSLRGAPKKRGDNGGGYKDAYFKDNRGPHAFYSKDDALPEYEAWRAERNRIDEARINRQKTAEGNWRREWDSNKTNVEKESLRKGDTNRKDSNNYEKRNNHFDCDYINRGHGGNRTYHGTQKNLNHQDYRRSHHEQSHEYKKPLENKSPLSPSDERTVTVTDKSIKVTLNHGIQAKTPVMSVKVNSPSIAGTGRVGPRQKSRITYSSQSDADITIHELNKFSRQKSFDEKTIGTFNSGQKLTPKSPFSQRKKESNSKSPYLQKKEFKNDEYITRTKNATKTSHSQKNENQKQFNNFTSKIRIQKRSKKLLTNKTGNFSISDEAIPIEYNPDKSFNNHEGLIRQMVVENDTFEKTLNETNNVDKEVSDTLKCINDFVVNDKSINKNIDNMEDTIYLNSDNIKIQVINKNYEFVETNESYIKNSETDVYIDKSIEHEISNSIKATEINKNIKYLEKNGYIEKDKDNNSKKTCENLDEHVANNQNCKNISHTISEKNNKTYFPNFDISVSKQNHNLSNYIEENIIEDIANEKIQMLLSKTIEKMEPNKSYENTETKTIALEQKDGSKIINNEFQKTNEDCSNTLFVAAQMIHNKNEVDAFQEQNLIESNICQKKSVIISNLIDVSNESIDFNTNKVIEFVGFDKKLADDSGFIEDLDKFQNNLDTSIIKPNNKNNIENILYISMESDLVETYKEICKKKVEICDIQNAEFNKASGVIFDSKCYSDTINSSNNKQEINNILENYTKDNKVLTVQNINSCLETLKNTEEQKTKQNKSIEEFGAQEQSTIVDFDKVNKITLDELMKIDVHNSIQVYSEETTEVTSDESKTLNSNELIQVVSNESVEDALDESKQG